jgi:hypothetical protein
MNSIIPLPAGRRETRLALPGRSTQDQQFAHLYATRVLFLDASVPVVQRIEQGFPKSKTALLHTLADVVTNVQTTVFEPIDYLLQSSRVIRNLRIFTCPGDTEGDTKRSTIFASASL